MQWRSIRKYNEASSLLEKRMATATEGEYNELLAVT